MYRLDFDPHALDQMSVRQIPQEAVYHVIEDFDRRIDRADGVTECFGTWHGRDLLVVVRWVDEDEEDGYVITVIDTNTRRWRRR